MFAGWIYSPGCTAGGTFEPFTGGGAVGVWAELGFPVWAVDGYEDGNALFALAAEEPKIFDEKFQKILKF